MSPMPARPTSAHRSIHSGWNPGLAGIVGLAWIASLGMGCEGAPPEPVGSLVAEPAALHLAHGEARDVVLRFEPSAELGANAEPMVFVHLVDGEGQVVLTADHALPADWRPGEPIDDRVRLFHSALGPALPTGSYQMTVGLYQGDERWALDAGEPVARQEYAVATVEVPEHEAGPDATFSEEWMPVSLGADRQVVARRWLGGAGHFEVPATDGRKLALELQIPHAAEGQKLVLDEGAENAAVRVAASCSGFAATVGGSGSHRIEVPVGRVPQAIEDTEGAEADAVAEDEDLVAAPADPAATEEEIGEASGACRVTFEANYQLVDTQTFGTAILSLEQLAWLGD